MNFSIVLDKGIKGLLTVIASVLVASIPQLQEFVLQFLPPEVAELTLIGLVAFLINALANYIKHLGK